MMAMMTNDIEAVYEAVKRLELEVFLPPPPAPDGSESEMVVFDPAEHEYTWVQRHR